MSLREKAGEVALAAIKYVLAVVLVIGSMVAVFYTSQATQDSDRSGIKERVSRVEAGIDAVKEGQRGTQAAVEKQREDIARTREEMAKLSQAQQAMSVEQRELGAKMDDVRGILIRLERRGP